MEAKVTRGFFLEVNDEKGSYRIPIGRRSRKCLIVLDKREGEFVRSLELDLFTGFVYYCVDNLTSGGLSYYYDMSSKKVGHYFIHRYLRLAAVRGFGASPQERDVFEKLPCENWQELMETLPGWKEAIENRIENLLLPEKEAVQIRIPGAAGAGSPQGQAKEAADVPAGIPQGQAGAAGRPVETVVFSRYPEAYPAQAARYVFQFVKDGDKITLQHLDENVGREFFGENEEYERYLTEAEYAWLRGLIQAVLSPGAGEGGAALAAVQAQEELLSDSGGMVTQEMEVRYAGEGAADNAAIAGDAVPQGAAAVLYKVLRGLLRREIELV